MIPRVPGSDSESAFIQIRPLFLGTFVKQTPIWLVAISVVSVVAIAETTGALSLSFGAFELIVLPFVFAFLLGLVLNPNVLTVLRPVFGAGAGTRVAKLVTPAVMPLVVLMSVQVGPNFDALADAGLALIAQELGNLGTMLLSMPLAVLVFRMGREAVGATFSIAREGGLAFVFDKYGPNSREATGVMAVYICGTVFGAAVFSIIPPFIASMELFDIRALAMACGIGSASMTGACTVSLVAVKPEESELISALAAGSNLVSSITGLFVSVFVAMPLANLYFRILSGGGSIRRQDDR